MQNNLCPACKYIRNMLNGGYCLPKKRYVEYRTENKCDDYEQKEE